MGGWEESTYPRPTNTMSANIATCTQVFFILSDNHVIGFIYNFVINNLSILFQKISRPLYLYWSAYNYMGDYHETMPPTYFPPLGLCPNANPYLCRHKVINLFIKLFYVRRDVSRLHLSLIL